METIPKTKTTRKRCPVGQERDKKTGECVPKKIKKKDMTLPTREESQPMTAPVPMTVVPAPAPVPVPVPVPAPAPVPAKKARTTRKKTNKTVPVPVPASAVPASAVTALPAVTAVPVPAPVLSAQEIKEREQLTEEYNFLYPDIDDPLFNIKIAERKEFHDNQYDGEVEKYKEHEAFKEHADKLCNSEFELAPHQIFIRNFLSFQTPYNSLLLYHGLGSGKTCSAISVAEEMRDYIIQMGITSQIFIVASPNVLINFKNQLFD